MALAPDDKKLMGARFGWLMDASQLTGAVIAERMGVSESTITKMKAGESMTADNIKKSTAAMKGEGQLVEDQNQLIVFLLTGTDTRTVLRPSLRLVGEDQPLDSAPDRSTKGRSLSTLADSMRRKAA